MENSEDQKQTSSSAGFYRAFGLWTGVGTQLAVAVGLLSYGGWALDQRLDTEPLFLIGGAALGMTAGFVNLFRILKIEQQAKEREKNESKSRKSAT